jgi:hypothetical protein
MKKSHEQILAKHQLFGDIVNDDYTKDGILLQLFTISPSQQYSR